MNKERELLERACDVWDEANYSHTEMHVVFNEIRAYLAQQEQKREALSEKAIGLESELIRKRLLGSQGLTEFGWFEMGVRFAERHHGIGGGNE